MTEDDEDERFPGNMNYLDWLMHVLKPTELTPKNIDQLIAYQQKAMAVHEAGGKIKKADVTLQNSELVRRLIKPKPKLALRGF